MKYSMLFLLIVFLVPAAAGTFHVDKEGARPNRDFDSGPAIWKAIEKAAKTRNSIVLFSPGVYKISSQTKVNNTHCFKIFNADGLILKGAKPRKVRVKGKYVQMGTELRVMSPEVGCLFFSKSKNIRVQDLIIDYETLPYTQGRITAVNRNGSNFDVEIDKGYPLLSAPYFMKARHKWGMIFDKELPRPKAVDADHLYTEKYTSKGGQLFNVQLAGNSGWRVKYMEAGDRWVQLARTATVVLKFHRSEKIVVENVTIHASPAITSAGQFSEDITIKNYQVRIRPGTDRVLASNGDGFHFVGCRDGIKVLNSYFEGIADDGININGHGFPVKKIVSPTQIHTAGEPVCEAGDVFQVVDPATGGIKATMKVKSAKYEPKFKAQVVNFIKPYADLKSSDLLFNLGTSGCDYLLRNNTFSMHRRHGMLIRAARGIIEDNTIEYVGSLGIDLTNEMAIPEGPVAFDVVIRNNTIRGVGYGPNYGGGAIRVAPEKKGYSQATARSYRDITIEGNTIINAPEFGIYVGSSQNVTVRNNTIKEEDGPFKNRIKYGLVINNSNDVTVDGHKTHISGNRFKAAVRIDKGVDAGDKGIVLKKLESVVPETALEIEDKR